MDWNVWGPAILSSLAAAGIGGAIVKSLVENSVKHAFDRQIEILKSDLRESESELQSVRSNILNAQSARNIDLIKRRQQAAETLWSATLFQRSYSMSTMFAQVARMDAISDLMERGGREADGVRDMAKMLWDGQNPESLSKNPLSSVGSERLFVPPRAWLAYQAIASLSARSSMVLAVIKSGMSPKNLMKDHTDINAMVQEVLPHQRGYIEKSPDHASYWLTGQLEEVIFFELMKLIAGDDYDFAAARKAADLVRKTKEHQSEQALQSLPPQLRVDPPSLQ
ncbi:hypothetical protein AB9E28_09920 [Rhizobium leguminosarum]|uniref:hypothetical protein n=1 Tax=Rhizobium leguminosarum TaxID=384 RepID=UPI003F97D5B0